MAFTVLIHPEALVDIQQGIDFYNLRKPRLGARFLSAVKATITEIKKNPYYKVRYDNVRCRLVKKFPYLAHFSVDEKNNSITFYRLKHTSIQSIGE